MNPSDLDFLNELRQDFLLEAEEHLQTLTSGILELEKPQDPPAGLVESVFRSAHSLKGAAHAVQMPKVAFLCQSMESVFARLKNRTLSLEPKDYDMFQRALDCLAGLIRDPDRDDEESRSFAKVMEDLSRSEIAVSPLPPQMPREEPIPSPVKVADISREVPAAVGDMIRIKASKVDTLLLQAEEMISVRLALDQRLSELRALIPLVETCRRTCRSLDGNFSASLSALDDGIRRVAKAIDSDGRVTRGLIGRLLADAKDVLLLPASTLIQSFPKMARDLSRDMGKDVDFLVSGGDVEVDKRILEGMKDPLVHLLRNALDHGVEKPEERRRLGKPSRAKVVLSIGYTEGGQVEISMTDDGRGIDVERLRSRAVLSGLLSEEEAEGLDQASSVDLIFRSGLSTSALITDISGRGLGMAIVREKVEALGGSISVRSVPNGGTAFQMTLPLFIATFRGVLVEEGDRLFVLPTAKVERVLRVFAKDVRSLEGRETVSVDGRPLPLVRLGGVLNLELKVRHEGRGRFPLVVLSSGSLSVAFAVHGVLGEQEILLKGLGPQLVRVPFVSGATVLGSGKVVPVLNVKDLITAAMAKRTSVTGRETEEKTVSVLLVEDSITSRTLLKNILTSAGYSVTAAVDGQEGWDLLSNGRFDMVVSDVEMPRMNGFELTEAIRSNPAISEIPVVLVTSLDSQRDRERGIEVGADAYIVKSAFDQGALLEVMRRLL